MCVCVLSEQHLPDIPVGHLSVAISLRILSMTFLHALSLRSLSMTLLRELCLRNLSAVFSCDNPLRNLSAAFLGNASGQALRRFYWKSPLLGFLEKRVTISRRHVPGAKPRCHIQGMRGTSITQNTSPLRNSRSVVARGLVRLGSRDLPHPRNPCRATHAPAALSPSRTDQKQSNPPLKTGETGQIPPRNRSSSPLKTIQESSSPL